MSAFEDPVKLAEAARIFRVARARRLARTGCPGCGEPLPPGDRRLCPSCDEPLERRAS